MKVFDLETRTESFAAACRAFIRKIDKDLANIEDCRQLARSSGSTSANCIEANEAVSKKDRTFRFKVCRKEARESRLWLNLLYTSKLDLTKEKDQLADEATQLVKIFSTILRNMGGSDKPEPD